MARPLRIDVEDGWYTVTARGIERRTIFCDERYGEHFLELLEAVSERYGLLIHGYVLMGNHYHLLVQSPLANVSAAMQWLNVSYGAWFNAKRGRVGHVFQGRFGSRLIDGDGAWVLEASVYLHLNPVRIKAQGLDKGTNRAESAGFKAPTQEETSKRLKALRDHRWSSYPAYAGYAAKPGWLETGVILGRAGGRPAYRRYVESHVTRGEDPEAYMTLKDQWIIGAGRFIEQMKEKAGRVTKEHPERRQLERHVAPEQIVGVVEKIKRQKWEDFRERHGDWGKGLVLYLARKRSGRTLKELGAWLGGEDYKTVSKTIARFATQMEQDKALAKLTSKCIHQMSNVET